MMSTPASACLRAWLGDRLKCEVTRKNSDGPGITGVVLSTRQGDVTISRFDGRLATLSSPNQPDRPVALKRRDLDELLSEELRRLDPDDMAKTGSRAAPKPTKKTIKKAAPKGATKG